MTKYFIKKDSYKWMILAISFLLMTVFSISLQALPPIFSKIVKDIPFSNGQAGMLMSAYAIMGIVFPFLVAFFVNRLGIKKLLMIALIMVIIGLLGFSFSSYFSWLLFFRVVSGMGAAVLTVLSPFLITIFFDRKNLGTAMGVFNTAVPFGTVLAANLFGFLGEFINWRIIIVGIAIFVGIVLAMILIFLSLPKDEGNNGSASSHSKFKMGSGVWLLASIWMLVNIQLLSYITFGPQFFKSAGVSTQQAGLLTSLIMLVSIFLAPIIGIIIDKIGQKKILLFIGSIIMGLSFAFIATSFLSLPVWAIALGIGLVPVPVCIFALLPEVVSPDQVSLGLAILTAASNLGITIGPAGFGSLLDRTSGNFFIGFITLSTLSLIIIFISLRIRTRER